MEEKEPKVWVDFTAKDKYSKYRPVCYEVSPKQVLRLTVPEAFTLAEELEITAKQARDIMEMENTLSTVSGYAQNIVDEVKGYFDSDPSERNADNVLHDIGDHFEQLKDLMQ